MSAVPNLEQTQAIDVMTLGDRPRIVLMVDDDPAFRFLCARHLGSCSRNDFRVLQASDAHEAMQLLTAEAVDAILLDYGLPDTTGASFLHSVRLLPAHEHTAIVVVTASGSEEIATEVLRAGASDYIAKRSVTRDSLSRAVGNALVRADLHNAVRDRAVELERANQQLRKRNDEVARFYHTVSHETKTPLTAALLFLSMLEQEVVGTLNADQRELVEQATQSCKELVRHFDALIDSTRLEAGKLQLSKAPEDLARVVERALAGVRPAAEEKDIALSTVLPDDLPELVMDGSRMVQVLANLLGNAVKFTPVGGSVSLAARVSADAQLAMGAANSLPRVIEISVADTGIGIEADDLARVFDRLYQVGDKGDATVGAGLGLGLTIAREIVSLHGGGIGVSSTPGAGTIFTIRLPMETAGSQSDQGSQP